MPAAYVILHNRIDDAEAYGRYLEQVPPTMLKHGAEILVIDDHAECVEGQAPFPRTVLLKFPSRDAVQAWYSSPEYQEILPIRTAATDGFAVVCDEFVMPQG
jgi:uncharacterized protein (DUF1330 family)